MNSNSIWIYKINEGHQQKREKQFYIYIYDYVEYPFEFFLCRTKAWMEFFAINFFFCVGDIYTKAHNNFSFDG